MSRLRRRCVLSPVSTTLIMQRKGKGADAKKPMTEPSDEGASTQSAALLSCAEFARIQAEMDARRNGASKPTASSSKGGRSRKAKA